MNTKADKKKKNTVNAVIHALLEKKEIKSRVQSGEDLRIITIEKGLKLVLPL